jgi:hypothetical protein
MPFEKLSLFSGTHCGGHRLKSIATPQDHEGCQWLTLGTRNSLHHIPGPDRIRIQFFCTSLAAQPQANQCCQTAMHPECCTSSDNWMPPGRFDRPSPRRDEADACCRASQHALLPIPRKVPEPLSSISRRCSQISRSP